MRRDLQPLQEWDEIAVDLKILTGRRYDLAADRTRAINRMRAQLLEYFPALERTFDYAASKAALILLTGYQTPAGLRRVGPSRLGEALACALEQEMVAGPVDEAALLAGFVAAQGGDRGPAAGAAADADDGGLPASAPGAGAGRSHGESGFVLEDGPGPGRRREAFTRGHTSFFHSSRGLRAGACPDQPCRFSSRHTVATDRLTRRCRQINVGTRARVQRSSSKPCADGPLPSSSSSTANCSSVTVGAFAGPADRKPSMPFSRQARRQRSTDRTLTRSSLAMTTVFSPAANRSPA